MFSIMPADGDAQPHGQHEGEHDQAHQHVDGVKAGEQEVGAGPHVAAGDHDRQPSQGYSSLRPCGAASPGGRGVLDVLRAAVSAALMPARRQAA